MLKKISKWHMHIPPYQCCVVLLGLDLEIWTSLSSLKVWLYCSSGRPPQIMFLQFFSNPRYIKIQLHKSLIPNCTIPGENLSEAKEMTYCHHWNLIFVASLLFHYNFYINSTLQIVNPSSFNLLCILVTNN